jgi:2-C-methyl-D-erythritol 2,4-cyclodiphosphate synthase
MRCWALPRWAISANCSRTPTRRSKGLTAALLREAWRRIQAKGYSLCNVDVTIIAQAPKMLPHIPQMRVFIAEDLGCHMDDVNVKATTTEKLGFTGRGEGIACEAVALLVKAAK